MRRKLVLLSLLILLVVVISPFVKLNLTKAELPPKYVVVGGEVKPSTIEFSTSIILAILITIIAVVSMIIVYSNFKK